MLSPKATKTVFALGGSAVGGLLVGALCLLHSFLTQHHYSEAETFFRGSIAGKTVLGISYFDYYGAGIMESNQWKIQLVDSNRQSVTIYQNRPVFQESLPHQPEITITNEQLFHR